MRWALVDFSHPFFNSLVRRIVIFCVVAGWTAVEFFGGSQGWTLFFLALTAYTGWGFFLSGQVGTAPTDGDGAGKAPPPDDKT
ncbi:hypothetical protein [Hoeflea sp.]|uniref:hypothetical protein n=1 Tax=Hoeflea sp. TaxID=1940281 RepID=UPI00198C4833|nr:hypothetical protein [Hoeflea sp.]MBC7281970.1 hypothetical protein [Hoeflea sp.]